MFLEKHRKGICISAVALILFLIISLFTVNPGGNESVARTISPSEIAQSTKLGYEAELGADGGWIYTAVNGDPQIHIALSGEAARKITIHFADSPKNVTYIQIYYSGAKAGGISEPNSVYAYIQSDGKTAVAYLPHDNYGMVRLDINGSFAFESVELSMCDNVISLNLVSLIFLFIIIILTLAFEQRLRLYSSVKNFILSEISSAKSLSTRGERAVFVLRQAANASLCLFVLLITVFLTGVIISKSSIIFVFFFGLFTVVLNAVYRIFFLKERSTGAIFLIIALVFGMVLAYSMPITTWNSWDEEFHYGRAIDLKNIIFSRQSTTDILQEARAFSSLSGYLKDIKAHVDMVSAQAQVIVPSQKADINQTLVAYIPYALIMLLADIFGTGYFAEIVLAKFFNAFVCIFVIYLGMRRIKSGRLIYATVALIPSVIFTMSSFSYDAWIVAFIAHGYAYFISELQNPHRPLTVKNAVIMLLSFLVGAFPKTVYLLTVIPLLFMPKSKFSRKRDRRVYVAACIAVMLILLIILSLPFFATGDGVTDDRGGGAVNAGKQISFILKNPINYAKILLKFMGEYVSVSNMSGFISSYYLLGKASVFVSSVSIFLVFFVAIIDKKEEVDGFCDKPIVKISALLMLFLQIAAMASALYVAFTPVGSATVLGCQYRYLFPLFVPAMFLLGTPRLRCDVSSRTVHAVVFGLSIFSLFASFWEVYVSKMII